MQSRTPYYLSGAVTAALALSFAAGVTSASRYLPDTAEGGNVEAVVADLMRVSPSEYFPSRYLNQAAEIEPLPAQF